MLVYFSMNDVYKKKASLQKKPRQPARGQGGACSLTLPLQHTLLLTVLFLFLLLILLLLLLMRFVAVDVQVGEQPWFALSEEPAQWLHYLVSQP